MWRSLWYHNYYLIVNSIVKGIKNIIKVSVYLYFSFCKQYMCVYLYMCIHCMYSIIFTLHTCARGKVIDSVLVIIIMHGHKIAKSGDLGTWASCKCNKSVEFGQKLCLESSGMAYKRHKQHIFICHNHQPCLLCIIHAAGSCVLCSCVQLASYA